MADPNRTDLAAAGPPRGSSRLLVGTWNVHSLYGASQQKYKRLSNNQDGWADVHDICVLTDTKLSSERLPWVPRDSFPRHTQYHSTVPTPHGGVPLWGVTILVKNGIPCMESSRDWPLPQILQGRFLACKLQLPSCTTPDRFSEIWVIGIYAPNRNPDSAAFYKALLETIEEKVGGDQIIYLAGDFNAAKDPLRGRSRLGGAAPTPSEGDANLYSFMQGTLEKLHFNWCDPYDYTEDQSLSHTYTYRTRADPDDPEGTIHRIDHIWGSTHLGMLDIHCDPDFVLNPLGVDKDMYEQISDHKPVSVSIDLHQLDACFVPEAYQKDPYWVVQYPHKGLDQDLKFHEHLALLREVVPEKAAEYLQHPDNVFNADLTEEERDSCTRIIQEVLGRFVPQPFRKQVDPSRKRNPLSPLEFKLRRELNHIKHCIRAVWGLHKHYSGEKPLPRAKLFAFTARCSDTRFTKIPPPSFAIEVGDTNRHFDITDAVCQDWLTKAKEAKGEILPQIKTERERVKSDIWRRFSKAYEEEAGLRSRRFRALVFPRDPSNSSVTFLGTDGQTYVFDRQGILDTHRHQWESLGRALPLGDLEGTREAMRAYLDPPQFADARARVGSRSHEVMEPVTEEELRAFLAGKRSTAPSPGDKITYKTLKVIFNLAPHPGLSEELQAMEGQNLAALRTLVLGFINMAIRNRGYDK